MSNLYKSLLEAQKEMGSVKKDAKNPFFKSTFATLNSVRETAIPVLNKHGIVLTQPTVMVDNKVFVKTELTHAESSESTSSLTEVIVKNPQDAQQVGSGISYARRYGIMSLLCLAAEDDDGNGAVAKAVIENKSEESQSENNEQRVVTPKPFKRSRPKTSEEDGI